MGQIISEKTQKMTEILFTYFQVLTNTSPSPSPSHEKLGLKS